MRIWNFAMWPTACRHIPTAPEGPKRGTARGQSSTGHGDLFPHFGFRRGEQARNAKSDLSEMRQLFYRSRKEI